MHDGSSEPVFVADAVGLDFLNSVARPVDARVEWLGSGEALLTWLGSAGLVPPDAVDGLRRDALPGELDAVAARARSLREWFRGFVLAHKGAALTADAMAALEPLNRLLARDEQYARVEPASPGLRLVMQRRWDSSDALLAPIARAIAEVICNEDFAHIKACQGPVCTLLFADHTRGRARRWCSMAVCGNRAKQAAHRRSRTATSGRRTAGKHHEETDHQRPECTATRRRL